MKSSSKPPRIRHRSKVYRLDEFTYTSPCALDEHRTSKANNRQRTRKRARRLNTVSIWLTRRAAQAKPAPKQDFAAALIVLTVLVRYSALEASMCHRSKYCEARQLQLMAPSQEPRITIAYPPADLYHSQPTNQD